MTLPPVLGRLCLLLVVTSLGVGCGSATEETTDTATDLPESKRGDRYCEVLLAFLDGDSVEAQVWGTQGLNDCPASAWATVDAGAIAAEFDATAAVLNGPRYWVLDRVSGEIPEGSPRTFGTLEMRRLVSLTLPRGTTSSQPYIERTVQRTSEFEYRAGSEVYELLAADGSVYVMQSYAQIVDTQLSELDLPGLGARLTVPAGWQYRARTLASPLIVNTPGEATVVQDELQNTYSLYVDGG